MYQALYRKYRPQTFDDVVGQRAVTQTLKNQIATGRLGHAYLFTGSRGTGKTSSAKILAKAVNCLDPQDGNPCNRCAACQAIDSGSCMDVLEIDAASNNGVDNVRDLRDDAVYTPSQVKMRVYIIDEVHMLSISAFNALLKILEEPPKHLLFILATTELHKVPATILSRCQRFAFRRISAEEIAARLQYVAYHEGIDLDDSAARTLARLADGGMRDALSLLDQCASATSGELNAQTVCDCLGIAGIQGSAALLSRVADRDTKGALALFNRFYSEGKDLGALLDELACLTRDLLILKTAGDAGLPMLSGVADDRDAQTLAGRFSTGELARIMEELQTCAAGFVRSASRRMDAELCILKLCQPELSLDAQAMNSRLTRLEERLQRGDFPAPQPQPGTPVSGPAPARSEGPEAVPEPETEVPPEPPAEEVPLGFWTEVAAAVRKSLSPPASGFFSATDNAPVKGVYRDGQVVLQCTNSFTYQMVNKPEILSLVAQKAGAILNRQVGAAAVDLSSRPANNGPMERLLRFGRDHSEIINIKD